MYCNSLYDAYFNGYDKTDHLAFATNDSVKKWCHIKIFFNHSANKRQQADYRLGGHSTWDTPTQVVRNADILLLIHI